MHTNDIPASSKLDRIIQPIFFNQPTEYSPNCDPGKDKYTRGRPATLRTEPFYVSRSPNYYLTF